MQTAEVQALLNKIYTANFRVGDLIAALPIDQWKLSDEERASFRQKTDALRASVATLEKARSDFYNHPDDSALGQAAATALQSLLPQIDDYAKALQNTPGASFAKDYQQAGSDLRDLDRQIEPYFAYLNPSQAPAPSTPSAQAPTQGQTTPTPAQAPAPTAPVPAEAPKAPAPSQPARNQIPGEAGQAQAAVAPAQVPPSTPVAPNPSANETAPAQAPPQPAQPPAAAAASAEGPAHPAVAAVAPAAMQPAEAQALLNKIYAANFRVGDLIGSLGIDQWKLGDQDRATIRQKADTLRTSVVTVEKARSDFSGRPDDLALGQATASAIQSLLPKIDEFAAGLANTPGANEAKEYQQAAGYLRSLDTQLEPYIAYLEAKNQPAAPSGEVGAAVETEVIKPAAALPPLTVAAPEKSPLNNEQLKTLLYQAYVPAFRIKDLLGQEHPDHWKIPDAERTVYGDASQALAKRLDDLARWRDQLEAHPDSLEAAFEVYAALDKVAEPAGIVGKMAGQYDDPKVGSEYLEKARQVSEFRNQIEPYVGYLLRRHDQAIGTVERNFVTCETELTSVMRPTTIAAEPMKNVLPVFKGRGRSVTRGAGSGKASAHSSKKNSAGKPALSGAKPAPSGAKSVPSGGKPAPSGAKPAPSGAKRAPSGTSPGH
ncbi:MAG TPA: hypothetical protein VG206_19860 [Terriglobia bacterium]|nr:hypothetical protein [Terriglobia bacterium]